MNNNQRSIDYVERLNEEIRTVKMKIDISIIRIEIEKKQKTLYQLCRIEINMKLLIHAIESRLKKSVIDTGVLKNEIEKYRQLFMLKLKIELTTKTLSDCIKINNTSYLKYFRTFYETILNIMRKTNNATIVYITRHNNTTIYSSLL